MREVLNSEEAYFSDQKKDVPRYCIVMPDRYNRAKLELDSLYENEYEFVNAVINKSHSWHGLNETIHQIVRSNLDREYIHLFEDDILFTSKKSRIYFEEVFSKLPSDWDIFLGGAYTHSNNYGKDFGEFIKMNKFSSLHCVILRNTTYRHILENKTEHMDYFLSGKKMNVYLCNPTVALQYPGYSYQFRRSTDYRHMEAKMNILK